MKGVCTAQGLTDFALAAAGGKVEGHSRLAYVPKHEAWSLWRRTSAALLPGAGGVVHPEADKVSSQAAPTPLLSAPLNAQPVCACMASRLLKHPPSAACCP